MKQSLMIIFVCGLLGFSGSVAGVSFVSVEPARPMIEMDFDEAVAVLDSEIERSFRLQFDLALFLAENNLDSWSDEADQDEALLIRLEAMEDEAYASDRLIDQAAIRLATDPDPARVVRAMQHMQPLALLAVMNEAEIYNDEIDPLVAAIRDSAPMQRRILAILGDHRPINDVVLDRERRERLRAIDLDRWYDEYTSYSIGHLALLPALILLPPSEAPLLLASIADGSRFAHLQVQAEELIASGWLRSYLDLPEEWLRERVEAGETVWLAALARVGDELDMPLLLEHIEKLLPDQQLALVTVNPDPAFLPLLADLHVHWLSAPCSECPARGEKYEAFTKLITAHSAMDLPRSMVMLEELIEIAPEDWREGLVSYAAYGLGRAESAAAGKLALDLMRRYPEVEFNQHQFQRWMKVDAVAARRLVDERAPLLVEKLIGDDHDELASYWQICSHLSLLLLAHDQGWFEPWPDLVAAIVADEDRAETLSQCNGSMIAALSESNGPLGILALLDLWNMIEAQVDEYNWLIRSSLTRDEGDQEPLRLTLLHRLEGSEIWDELPQRSTDMLMGLVDPRAPNLSCSAPEDWDPELLSDDDWGDYDEVNPGDD